MILQIIKTMGIPTQTEIKSNFPQTETRKYYINEQLFKCNGSEIHEIKLSGGEGWDFIEQV